MNSKSVIFLLIIFFGLFSFADNQIGCETLKLSPQFFLPVKKTPKPGWTETYLTSVESGFGFSAQLKVVDDILAYQNQRTQDCHLGKPIALNPLFENKRLSESNEIHATVAIGYNDSRPYNYVWDIYYYSELINKLTQPCASELHTNCGFRKTEIYDQHEAILEKIIWSSQKLILHIFKSALNWDDNINQNNPEQKKQSLKTERKFFDSFSNSEFVLYMGHSRNGGGPDFDPPELDSNKHPNYKNYLKKKEGSNKLISEMQKIKLENRPLFFGILGCSSQFHFEKKMRSVLPNSVLLMSKEAIYGIELFEGLMVMVNGIHHKKSTLQINIDLEAINIAHRMNDKKETSMLFLASPLNLKPQKLKP